MSDAAALCTGGLTGIRSMVQQLAGEGGWCLPCSTMLSMVDLLGFSKPVVRIFVVASAPQNSRPPPPTLLEK